MDVGEWLRGLGLSQYESVFRENEIDCDVLPNLTADDLKDLHITVVGHRRKLLTAIANLNQSNLASESAAKVSAISSRDHDAPAERRQLTVMFIDLVGSTEMSARLDPEDMREIVGAYHRCCADQIIKGGGFVAKYMGDGVLAYFGYPEAHEHDAEHAVLAALAVVEAVKMLKAVDAPLQVRIGIATGLVVVGDLIGSGEAQERGVVGDTPNLAARLQALAEPSMVLIADSTRRLLGNFFELRDLGRKELKGIVGPARAWAVVRSNSVESRFEALHTANLTALVGRDEESDLLIRRWSRAKTGEGQVVLIAGEAGIGKSRLTAALLERLTTESHKRLRYFCSPQHSDSALYPFIGQLERAAGLVPNDPHQVKFNKLDALLAQSSTMPEEAALIAAMLSLANEGRHPAQKLAPEQRRQRTLEALSKQLASLARQQPVLMIFEDAHWSDPTSLEVISQAIDRVRTLPVLLVITFRPEFNPPWMKASHVTSITLNRLGEREVAGIISGLISETNLSPHVMADIVKRTDGIPLFVEEMTKAVLEAQIEGSWLSAVPASSQTSVVPATLHASLLARLDRLGAAKEVAQIGATIGREFSYALLASAAGKSDAELASALDRLVQSGLLFRQGTPPQANYVFKHALVRDAAYGTLLREKRRALHARVAEAVSEAAESRSEILAHHYTEAGLTEKAVDLWSKIGHESKAQSALAEAVAQLNRALDLIVKMPMTPSLRRKQIELQVAVLAPLMHVRGWAASETRAAADRARMLIEQAEALEEPLDDPLLLFTVLYVFWAANNVAFDGNAVCTLASQFLLLAEKQSASAPLLLGHRIAGVSLVSTGQFLNGKEHLDKAIELYDPIEHRPLAARFGTDSAVAALLYRSWALWLLGYPIAALTDRDHALEKAREIGQASPLMQALTHATIPTILCGDYEAAGAQARELLTLVEKGSRHWEAQGLMNAGAALALSGGPAAAIEFFASGIAGFRTRGATLWLTFYLPHLAQAHLALGQFEAAQRCINEAITAIETSKEKWCEAEVYRVAGEIELKTLEPEAAKAQDYFERALTVARAQHAKSWELRAATSMALLWRDQGRVLEARELLVPVYNWFTEGFETVDLRNAKSLLDQLAP